MEAVSAVKALQLAAQQGQTIYTVTNQNKAEVLPKLNHRSEVMTDVTNALNAGHEVTISQSQINFKDWTGSGYIIIDPNNGSGAYLISGGANGAFLLVFFALTIFSISLFAIVSAASGGLIPILLAGLGLQGWLSGFLEFLKLGNELSSM